MPWAVSVVALLIAPRSVEPLVAPPFVEGALLVTAPSVEAAAGGTLI